MMSAQTMTKKRKTAGDAAIVAKRSRIAKSADKPAPLRSALKKSKDDTAVAKPAAIKSANPKKSDVSNGAVAQTPAGVPRNGEEPGGTALTADQTAALLAGFSSSEDEASDAEGNNGIPISKLPEAPRVGEIQNRIKAAAADSDDPERTPGVIYIGRLPHGFYEHQLKAYFSQFGEILRLRLPRNRKTGKSKHHAFIEFASAAVAEIVVKTMDKYLLFGHILQVKRVPREQVKEEMWKGSGMRRKKPAPRNRLEGARLRRGMTREEWGERVKNEEKRRAEKTEKLREMEYEFEMPALKGVDEVPVKAKADDSAAAEGDQGNGVKLLQDSVGPEEARAVVVRTVQAGPKGVTITEKKTTKKRQAVEATEAKKKNKKVIA